MLAMSRPQVRTRAVHVSLIALLVPAVMWSETTIGANIFVGLVFWLGGVAEAVGAGGGAAVVCNGIGKVTGAGVLAVAGFAIFFLAAFTIA